MKESKHTVTCKVWTSPDMKSYFIVKMLTSAFKLSDAKHVFGVFNVLLWDFYHEGGHL